MKLRSSLLRAAGCDCIKKDQKKRGIPTGFIKVREHWDRASGVGQRLRHKYMRFLVQFGGAIRLDLQRAGVMVTGIVAQQIRAVARLVSVSPRSVLQTVPLG
jgi:hypothetical protein